MATRRLAAKQGGRNPVRTVAQMYKSHVDYEIISQLTIMKAICNKLLPRNVGIEPLRLDRMRAVLEDLHRTGGLTTRSIPFPKLRAKPLQSKNVSRT